MGVRSEVLEAVESAFKQLDSEDIEDLHEHYSELIMDLEKAVSKAFLRIYAAEAATGGVELLEHFNSSGDSCLVLRVEGVRGAEKFDAAKKILLDKKKTLEKLV